MDRFDELWPSGPRLVQRDGVFKLGSDTVLLSDFVNLNRVRTVCDIGCGAGIIPILLNHRNDELEIDAVEISDEAVKLSQENFELNEVQVNLMHGDIRRYKELLTVGYYDLVITNPPYFPTNSGKTSEIEAIARARDERTCSLGDVIEAAGYILKWGGRFAIVFRPERLSELFCAMTDCGIEPKRLRMVHNRADSVPSLVLVEGKRGGNRGLSILPPLLLTDHEGDESAEVKRIYRRNPDDR